MSVDKVLILNGDGIGPSIMSSAKSVLEMTTSPVEILEGDIGRSAYEKTGQYLPHDTLDLLDECKFIMCGPTMVPDNGIMPLDTLKVQLDLFARIRYFKNLAPDLGVEDMEVTLWSSSNVVSEEITEIQDLDGVTLSKYVKNTAYGRMMSLALSDVEIRKLNNIACLTREDFFPISSGMFSETFDSMFPPEMYTTRHLNVKDWMMHIIKDPKHDQCILCVDLYNQIVAGVLSGLTGYDHICPICYMGSDYKLFNPNHVAVIDGLDEKYANPTSSIMSAAILLQDFGKKEEYDQIMNALCEAYRAGERTPDVGGTLSTEEFTQKVISRI